MIYSIESIQKKAAELKAKGVQPTGVALFPDNPDAQAIFDKAYREASDFAGVGGRRAQEGYSHAV